MLHILDLTCLSLIFFISIALICQHVKCIFAVYKKISLFWHVDCWRVARFRFGRFVVTPISLSVHSTLSDAQVRVRYEGCSSRSRKNVWRCNYQNEPDKLPYILCFFTSVFLWSGKKTNNLTTLCVNVSIIVITTSPHPCWIYDVSLSATGQIAL